MEFNLAKLAESYQRKFLFAMYDDVLRAIREKDARSWCRFMAKLMAFYERAMPKQITVPADFYPVLQVYFADPSSAVLRARGIIVVKGKKIFFRRFQVVATATTTSEV